MVCKQVGIENDKVLLGKDIDKVNDKELKKLVEKVDIFAKLFLTKSLPITALTSLLTRFLKIIAKKFQARNRA